MVIDARGMLCPWPAIRLARAIRDVGREKIELWADDPKAAGELSDVASAAGWSISSDKGRFLVLPPNA